MAYIPSNSLQLLANNYKTDIDKISRLAILQKPCSPEGYQIRMNYKGVFSISGEEKTTYVVCDAFHPSSSREVTQEEALSMIAQCHSQSAGNDLTSATATDLWLSREAFIELGLEVNPFTPFIFRMTENGTFDKLEYKKGDLIFYNSHQHIAKLDVNAVSHIFVHTGFAQTLSPKRYWSKCPFDNKWKQRG